MGREMKHLAIAIGHSPTSQGASGKLNDKIWTEFSYNTDLANDIALQFVERCIGDHVDVYLFRRQDSESPIHDLCGEINACNPNLAIELHCNSHADESISGTETLYWSRSKPGKEAAEIFQDCIAECLGLRDRGLKKITSVEQRGGTFLALTDCPSLILEPFFISNPSDLAIGLKARQRLAKAIAVAACLYLLDG